MCYNHTFFFYFGPREMISKHAKVHSNDPKHAQTEKKKSSEINRKKVPQSWLTKSANTEINFFLWATMLFADFSLTMTIMLIICPALSWSAWRVVVVVTIFMQILCIEHSNKFHLLYGLSFINCLEFILKFADKS